MYRNRGESDGLKFLEFILHSSLNDIIVHFGPVDLNLFFLLRVELLTGSSWTGKFHVKKGRI